MRELVFAAYEKPTGDLSAKLPNVVRIWALLFQSVTRNPQWKSDDALKYRASAKLLDKFDTLAVEEIHGAETQTRLKYEGASLLLEDGEFARLEDAWKTFKGQLGDTAAREKVMVDTFLETAPTVETIGLVK